MAGGGGSGKKGETKCAQKKNNYNRTRDNVCQEKEEKSCCMGEAEIFLPSIVLAAMEVMFVLTRIERFEFANPVRKTR